MHLESPLPIVVLRQLTRSLAEAMGAFERTSHTAPKTFPDYKKARGAYLEIQAMIFTIQDKAVELRDDAPADLKAWLARMRLRGLTAFTRVSLGFFREPPVLLVQALGAYEILEQEREAFANVLIDYDMLLFEASVDDKTADALDKVRVDMETVVGLLETLLRTAPPPLAIFR